MSEFADIVLKGSSIFTSETHDLISGAVIIKGTRIVDIVTEDEAAAFVGPQTQVHDCGDKLIMPAFNDAHTHFLFAGIQKDTDYTLDLIDCKSEQECVDKVVEFAAAHPDNAWIYGSNWNHDSWENHQFPSKATLDAAIPDRPVFLTSWDLHSGWTNSLGLELVGYTKDTPNPNGAIIARDDSGELTGLLREPAAVDPIEGVAIGSADMDSVFDKTIERALECGVASVGVVWPYGGMDEDKYIGAFRDIESKGNLPIRAHIFPKLEPGLKNARHYEKQLTSEHLRFAGVKQITDGVCESHTGYLTEPYADDPSTTGEPMIPRDELESLISEADEQGYSVRLHCIGNGAVKQALDAHEAVQKAHGKKGLHHTLEHIESCRPEDFGRFAALGVTPSMQPMHAVLNIDGYPELLGEKWRPYMWPMRSLIDAGAIMAFGTDYPVWELNPMEGLYAALTRKQPWDGYPEGGFVPEQRITLAEALQAYTYGAAYAENFEDQSGTLHAGKLADIVVMDRNLFESTPDEILGAKVACTIIDGKIAYGSLD